MPRNSSLSSTVASLLLEAEATADPIALNSAQDEAKVALKRLRTVNGSFLSNLEYVRALKRARCCRAGLNGSAHDIGWQVSALTEELETALNAIVAFVAESKMPRKQNAAAEFGSQEYSGAPSDDVERSVNMVRFQC